MILTIFLIRLDLQGIEKIDWESIFEIVVTFIKTHEQVILRNEEKSRKRKKKL